MADIKVKNTEGTEIASISADSINTKYDVTLVGQNVENFIIDMNNNFIKLLENFSGESAPPKSVIAGGSVVGQIWYDKANNKINYKNSAGWISNADQISGKKLDSVREYTLSGVDTSGKLSKTGGTITGAVNINGAIQVNRSVVPDTCDTISLGSANNRFRDIYLKEDGIRLGPESKGLTFRPHNFVYTVPSDGSDVSKFPKGAIILHQETGEAIIKKSTGTFGNNNNTFRKLSDDKQNSAGIGGNKFLFLGNIGLIAGGWANNGQGHANTNIERLSIPTPSNGSSFGNLSYGRSHMGSGMSSGSRGVFQGGWAAGHGSHNGKMDYVTFATPGNATYFGTLGYENYGSSSVSDGTRGVVGPGYNHAGGGPAGHHYTSNYITIETPGNASKFGTISSAYWGSAVSSGTRGVFGGYARNGWTGVLEYITIQTPSNSNGFGTTRRSLGPSPNAVTDAIRGVYFGGWNGSWAQSFIEYITISTPSNGTDFGRCQPTGVGAGVSDGIKGVSTNAWWTNTAEYVVIQTPSNGIHFGTLTMSRGDRPSSASGW